ncbi:hypothetical protein A2476_05445 [candidate division CPR3 bacterium RIFOXYC2_FULL_35_7]|nr:MAG: hypothetical protein A2476_05445 [candidate division CPR3 bacterium RIFOXYC2_FULL_35_7]
MKLVSPDELIQIMQKFGPEPLQDLTFAVFQKILQKKRLAIKKVLMDQSIFSGIGNIYANDALYLAKIHPGFVASKLNYMQSKALFQAVETVLRAGLKFRGASDNSYLDAFGNKGKYQEHFLIYRKQGQLCSSCGDKIIRIVVGGRGTFICPSCQKEKE